MALYKYLTIDTLKKILSGSIRFTQPGAFNDPFEMLPELHIPESFREQNLKIKFSLTAPRREPPVGELKIDFESKHCSDVNSRKILASLNQSAGILCLTRNPASLLMWSHYADEYAGAMIEFEEEHDFFEGLFDIEYRKHRPKKDISSYLSDGVQIPIAELCVKPKEWEYEREIRIVRSLSECKKVKEDRKFPIFVMTIPQDAIKAIILGERTTIQNQKKIWSLVKDTHIALSLAAISNWGYEFRHEHIKFNKSVSELSPIISPRTANIFLDEGGSLGEVARWTIKNHKLSEMVNSTV
jgi:hypothetical protein